MNIPLYTNIIKLKKGEQFSLINESVIYQVLDVKTRSYPQGYDLEGSRYCLGYETTVLCFDIDKGRKKGEYTFTKDSVYSVQLIND